MFKPVRRFFGRLFGPLAAQLRRVPVLGFQIGLLVSILAEMAVGEQFADLLEFRRIPRFFGFVDIFEPFSDLDFSGILAPFFPGPNATVVAPLQESGDAIGQLLNDFGQAFLYQGTRDPGFISVIVRVLIYDVILFVIPTLVVAWLLRGLLTRVLPTIPRWTNISLHLAALYGIIILWGGDGGTRELMLIYMGINIMLSVSLNLVNGYMGEFSVGHAGFMAVGAYVASVLTMLLFIDDRVFGEALLAIPDIGIPIGFIIALMAGGAAAAMAGLLVAFPSFRTRGDYLAIVTLAVNFIVQGVINNMEFIGGPRGLNGVPLWTNLNWVFLFTILSLAAIYNLVNSTFGKGIIAIREDEISAQLMGINTKRVKLVAFLVSSFIAGVAGGLFAHQLAFINPGTFGILKSTEALVMVYLGGMGSITGAIVAAVLFTLLIEALRPLAVLKWVVVPLTSILLMLFRPQGLFGFREINLNLGWDREDDKLAAREARDGAAGD